MSSTDLVFLCSLIISPSFLSTSLCYIYFIVLDKVKSQGERGRTISFEANMASYSLSLTKMIALEGQFRSQVPHSMHLLMSM
jgi:hypothetical protein